MNIQSRGTEFRFADAGDLPEHLVQMRDQVRRFVATDVLPQADAWEAAGKIPRDVFRKMGEIGLLGMRYPAEYGGSELGPLASIVFAEELGRSGYGGFSAAVLVHTDMSASHIVLRGTPDQKARWMPSIIRGETICSVAVTEEGAGSDVAGLRTRARRDGDSWVIDGSKMYITNAVYGNLLIVAARTDPEAKGSRGISLFLVPRDTPGVTVTKLNKHGWLCSDTGAIAFEGARVPADALLGEINRGFYSIMETFQNERVVLAGQCAGESARAIEVTVEYVKSRRAFGGSLWDRQVVRQKLASLATRAAAARQLAYAAAQMLENDVDCVREVSMVKALSPEVLHDVVHGCLQLHGGAGFMHGMTIERMVRDARVQTIGGGATEVMLEEVAKRM